MVPSPLSGGVVMEGEEGSRLWGEIVLEGGEVTLRGISLRTDTIRGEGVLVLEGCEIETPILLVEGIILKASRSIFRISGGLAPGIEFTRSKVCFKDCALNFIPEGPQGNAPWILLKGISARLRLKKTRALFQGGEPSSSLVFLQATASKSIVSSSSLYLPEPLRLSLFQGVNSKGCFKGMVIKSNLPVYLESNRGHVILREVFLNGESVCSREISGTYADFFNGFSHPLPGEEAILLDTSHAPIIIDLPIIGDDTEVLLDNPHGGMVVLREGDKETQLREKIIWLLRHNGVWEVVKSLPRRYIPPCISPRNGNLFPSGGVEDTTFAA